jgi:uncharacterized protein YbjQ (UPF0145 family)
MAQYCTNCGSKITFGGLLGGGSNTVYPPLDTRIVNFVNDTSFSELCESCGGEFVTKVNDLNTESRSCISHVENNIVDFPLFTVGQLPVAADYKIKAMVTANVSVGTGIFSELSQGFSDIFGVTNHNSGMALKVNSGEASARAVIVNKALAIGANCVIGVDIDYGITANNAATINMQGTAIYVANLETVLCQPEFEKAQIFTANYLRGTKVSRWLRGDFLADEKPK